MSCLSQHVKDFHGLHYSSLNLLELTLRMYSADDSRAKDDTQHAMHTCGRLCFKALRLPL